MNGLRGAQRAYDAMEHPSYYADDEEEPEVLPEVYCSSCGEGFGPGNEGFSACRQHEGKEQTT